MWYKKRLLEKRDLVQNFNELDLSPALMKAIADLGYEKPSPIQAQALPILLGEPTDFLGLAATGTGKTAAFAIPLLEKTDLSRRVVQTLVLCPTRELAIQVTDQINMLGKHLGVRALAVYGGSSFADQLHGLKRGVTVVVGTPGRVVDHMERGTLKLDEVDRLILDEADEMISMGFKDELEKILESVPEGMANIWLFSATMSQEIRKVADQYMNQPQQVQVNKTEMLPETVEQLYYVTQESNKPEVLCKLIDAADDFYGIVFCQTKALVMDLTQYLTGRSYRVDCLHGDMDQNARERTVKAFRERKTKLLICTDVASRGLDVKDITHVINYSIPRELDVYIHRIGRTARSGKSGFAMSLVTASHRGLIPRIEKMTKRRMHEGKIPSRKEVGAKKIAKVLESFQNQSSYERAVEVMGDSWKEAIAQMTPEEITGRFLTLMYAEIFSAREEVNAAKSVRINPAPTSSFNSHDRGEGRPRGDRGRSPRFERQDRPRLGDTSHFRDRQSTEPRGRPKKSKRSWDQPLSRNR
jgi:ATP-dependent RNA helicase DeaD